MQSHAVTRPPNQGLLPEKTRHTATKTATSGLARVLYGVQYLDGKTSRWISADPAMGEYIPQAPVNDEAKKNNKNLPGMGGVYNTVNMHVYHYAGNNPVKLVDPDGKTDIDYDNKIIHADLSDIGDLDFANRQLAILQGEGYKVVASDKDGRQLQFDSFGTLTAFLDEVDPHSLLPEGSTLTIGIGAGVFLVIGIGVEVGISYSKEKGFDFYITGGIGYGIGLSGDFTANVNVTPNVNLHRQTGTTATAGVGPAFNFDLENRGNFTGVSGVGVGGGVLHTGTITARGWLGDLRSALANVKKDFENK